MPESRNSNPIKQLYNRLERYVTDKAFDGWALLADAATVGIAVRAVEAMAFTPMWYLSLSTLPLTLLAAVHLRAMAKQLELVEAAQREQRLLAKLDELNNNEQERHREQIDKLNQLADKLDQLISGLTKVSNAMKNPAPQKGSNSNEED